MASRIKKGDTVLVIAGNDRGKQGKVLRVLPKQNKVLVDGINVVKKHQKPQQQAQGGIITKELPIAVSNVALVPPVAEGQKGKISKKVGFKMVNDRKVRYFKAIGEIIDVDSV